MCENLKGWYFPLLIFILCKCASIGDGPSGGEIDNSPPTFVKSTPSLNTIFFNKKKITLFFDKYVFLKDPVDNITIFPFQKINPIIKAIGKKIVIELKDTLIKNTTYTFNFNNGIVDYNEGNVLKNFNFTFSTGSVVDSLIISGRVLNAENLQPVANAIVGIYSNLSDTVFTKTPFLRSSQTNDNGYFQIKNLAPGIYRIFAIKNDVDKNFKLYSQNTTFAFGNTLVVPSCCSNFLTDTAVSKIEAINYNQLTPNDVLLYSFKEDEEHYPQYLVKKMRINKKQFLINFNRPIACFPQIHLLNDSVIPYNWYIMELSSDKKTILYWINNSFFYQKDTILIECTYPTYDTLLSTIFVADTIKLINEKKILKDEVVKEQKFLDVNINLGKSIDIFDTMKIVFSEPIFFFKKKWLHIYRKSDTSWVKQKFSILMDSLNPRVYYVNCKWDYNNEYKILIDSASVFSIYNKCNNFIKTELKVKSREEYGSLYIQIKALKDEVGFGQLLDTEKRIIKESRLINKNLIFENILPGKYYLRYIEDRNKNGKWDTGYYGWRKKQPELIYYYPDSLEVKKYEKSEYIWNIKDNGY